jgi:ABC-type nitrate/sulfonate/bicarbonate transport system permease component
MALAFAVAFAGQLDRHLQPAQALGGVAAAQQRGTEVEVGAGLAGAIVGEYLGGNEGLGALVVKTLSALMVEHMFATVIALACLGFAFYGAITSIRRFAVPWHESSQDGD